MPETIYLDPELAARADALFRELGLALFTAVQLFLLQSLRENGLPFTPRLTPPSAGGTEAGAAVSDDDRTPLSDKERIEETPLPSADEAEVRTPSGRAYSSDRDDTETKDDGESEHAPARDESGDDIAPSARKSSAGDGTGVTGASPAEESAQSGAEAHADGSGSELRQAFLNARLIGAPLRRVRSLNRLYSIGEPNDHVQGWREVYVSGDEPFALDFGMVRVELGFHGGGSLRMMDGRLPDEVLEADAVYPRDLSAVFSSVIGQRLVDVASTRIWNEGREGEQLCLRFANGCTLNFAPGGDWGALWLTDAHGAVMFAPEAVWLRVLDDRAGKNLR